MIDLVLLTFVGASLLWPAAAAFVLWDATRRAAPPLLWWLLTLLTGPVGLLLWLGRRDSVGPPVPSVEDLLSELTR